jgi:hypothetical protein
MFISRLKAAKALVLAGIVGGLVVSCETGSLTNALIPQEEQQKQVASQQKDASYLTAEKYVNEQLALLRKQEKALNPEIVRSLNRYSEAISRSAAVWLANPNSRQSLHNACMERFDGETNVLWETADKRLGFSRQIADVAQRTKQSDEPSQILSSAAEVQKALGFLQGKAQAPMHLFWYNAEKWDKHTAPLVAYIPADRKKSDFGKPLPGFDAEGNAYQITEAMAKQRPVVVFTINERTTAKGELRSNMITPQNQSSVASNKSVARVQSGERSININSVYFSPTANYDEWGNGTYEIFYDVDHEVLYNGATPYYTSRQQRVIPQGNGNIWGQYPLGVTIGLHGSNNHASYYSSVINGYLGVIFKWWEDDTFFNPDGNENDYIFDDYLGWHGTFNTPVFNASSGSNGGSGAVTINFSVY